MINLKEQGITGVIDSHTHSGGTDTYNYYAGNSPHSQSVEDLTLKAILAGIETVITTPFPGSGYYDAKALVEKQIRVPSGLQDFPYEIENKVIAQDCSRATGVAMLAFACVDPMVRVNEQLALLEGLHGQGKIFGLKFHTLACGCNAKELKRSGIAEFALSKKMPILIHSGRDAISHPQHILDLAREYPSLAVCIAHLADLDHKIIDAIPKHENVFIDCAPFLRTCRAVKERPETLSSPNLIDPANPASSLFAYYNILKDHLIWGTDEPWTTSVNVKGRVSGGGNYFDEAALLVDLYKLSQEATFAITNKNTQRYLNG